MLKAMPGDISSHVLKFSPLEARLLPLHKIRWTLRQRIESWEGASERELFQDTSPSRKWSIAGRLLSTEKCDCFWGSGCRADSRSWLTEEWVLIARRQSSQCFSCLLHGIELTFCANTAWWQHPNSRLKDKFFASHFPCWQHYGCAHLVSGARRLWSVTDCRRLTSEYDRKEVDGPKFLMAAFKEIWWIILYTLNRDCSSSFFWCRKRKFLVNVQLMC